MSTNMVVATFSDTEIHAFKTISINLKRELIYGRLEKCVYMGYICTEK